MTSDAEWFGAFYFDDTPVAVALAALTQLEAQVVRYEAEVLQAANNRIPLGTAVIVFTPIRAVAVAESAQVPAGGVYQADLFLGNPVYFDRRMRLTVNDKPLVPDANGRGFVKMPVPAWQPGQPDTLPAQWQGAITLRNCRYDTTLRVTVPYFIVKQPKP